MDKSWILRHERILIVVIGLIAAIYLVNRYLDSRTDGAIAKNAVAQQVVQEQQAQNSVISKQLVTQLAQYQDLVTTLATQNVALAKASGQRQVELEHQQKVDQSLPLPDLAVRWTHLASLQPADIKNTDQGLLVTEAGSRATVHVLETVPVLQKDLSDSRTVLTNKDKHIESTEGIVSGLQTQVTGLKAELSAKDTACKTELNLEKAKARRGKVKAFITGVGIGVGVMVKLVL